MRYNTCYILHTSCHILHYAVLQCTVPYYSKLVHTNTAPAMLCYAIPYLQGFSSQPPPASKPGKAWSNAGSNNEQECTSA